MTQTTEQPGLPMGHPDRGGSQEKMAEVNRAWEQAQEALR